MRRIFQETVEDIWAASGAVGGYRGCLGGVRDRPREAYRDVCGMWLITVM
ncbi:hypothetical protein [Paenibacillus residui]|uniref:Uncharacterized protein n=1 Tax=Paenibacillus residui TaxID=629724 RepID=A0ABW3DAA2_9BACL